MLTEVRDALTNVPLDRIKATKKSLFGVHDRAGQACPECGGTVAEVSYVYRSMQYCPICQTGGKSSAIAEWTDSSNSIQRRQPLTSHWPFALCPTAKNEPSAHNAKV